MRKIVVFFIVLLGSYNVFAQSVLVQRGITYRYNGKNPRIPIGGVYVKTATSPNGVVSDEGSGTFVLKLQNIKMGDRLSRATVSKAGLMIFNQQAVDEWSARKEPLKLILCDANQFQKQKNNLIAIGRNQAEKKYKKRLAEFEKRNKAQQLTLDEYYAKLDSINRDSILTKTCFAKAGKSVKYTFPSKNKQILAVVAEAGGRVTMKVHVTNKKGLNKRYDDTTSVKLGLPNRKTTFMLPGDCVNTVELEVVNCSKKDISFVVISN